VTIEFRLGVLADLDYELRPGVAGFRWFVSGLSAEEHHLHRPVQEQDRIQHGLLLERQHPLAFAGYVFEQSRLDADVHIEVQESSRTRVAAILYQLKLRHLLSVARVLQAGEVRRHWQVVEQVRIRVIGKQRHAVDHREWRIQIEH
jgi:hypothetical protein